jgi:hypothetical protein
MKIFPRFTSIVQQWFKEEWGGSLMLPDGCLGLGHDDQHSLTSVSESLNALTLVLDKKLTLRFEGLKSLHKRDRELVFGSFDALRLEWEGFSDHGQAGIKEYRDGEAKFVSAAAA